MHRLLQYRGVISSTKGIYEDEQNHENKTRHNLNNLLLRKHWPQAQQSSFPLLPQQILTTSRYQTIESVEYVARAKI
jgi:hypothetical protein